MRRVIRFVLPPLTLFGAIAAVSIAIAPGATADPGTSGAFVIGDGNAAVGSDVTFWGAQWWKDNAVSGGRVPPAFKGYALDIDLTSCTFTTRPGNSPPPPEGPLAGTIAVLVANSVDTSGPTISGTVTGIALVQTKDGYAPDPGHAGTGTVVGFVPCGPSL